MGTGLQMIWTSELRPEWLRGIPSPDQADFGGLDAPECMPAGSWRNAVSGCYVGPLPNVVVRGMQ